MVDALEATKDSPQCRHLDLRGWVVRRVSLGTTQPRNIVITSGLSDQVDEVVATIGASAG
jgi:hypothetical protein